ncbi:MAG: hypothetical protein AAGI34_04590 [Pseudomonadota bacterium]
MSWSEVPAPKTSPGPTRRAALTLLALPLAGCFRPMLAENAEASRLRGLIALPAANTRTRYYLGESLAARLGRPARAELRLEVDLALSEQGLAITPDSAITRRTVIAIAPWRLVRAGLDAPVLAAAERAEAGYNETADLFATRAAKRDVEARLAREIGERIARSILARASTVEAALS